MREIEEILERVEEGMTTTADAEVLRRALGLDDEVPDSDQKGLIPSKGVHRTMF